MEFAMELAFDCQIIGEILSLFSKTCVGEQIYYSHHGLEFANFVSMNWVDAPTRIPSSQI
jgi:hypothetical protein